MASTVLILEDDPQTVEVVQLYLRQDGHNVLSATDGITGLSFPCQAQPDLIVLDLMLPGMDGLSVCREIRSGPGYVPVLMLTAKSTELDRVLGGCADRAWVTDEQPRWADGFVLSGMDVGTMRVWRLTPGFPKGVGDDGVNLPAARALPSGWPASIVTRSSPNDTVVAAVRAASVAHEGVEKISTWSC